MKEAMKRTLLVFCTFFAFVRAETIEIETEYPVVASSSSTAQPSTGEPTVDGILLEEYPTVKPKVQGKENGLYASGLDPEHRADESGVEIGNQPTTRPASAIPRPGGLTVPEELENVVAPSSDDKPNKEAELDKELEKANQAINAYLTEVLEKLGAKMKSGDPSLKMPVLEPLHLEDRELSPIIGHEIFDIKMKKITFKGISDFKVTHVDSHIKDMRVKIGIHLPVTVGQSDFSANGTIFEVFQVSGDGNASMTFRNVYARTTLYLNLQNGKLIVDSADQPYVDFQDADVKFLNVERKARTIPQQYGVYGQIAPILFWLFSGDIVDEMDQHLAAYLNDAFQKFETPSILNEANLHIRLLRIHVPQKPWPYAYINPSYFHNVHRTNL